MRKVLFVLVALICVTFFKAEAQELRMKKHSFTDNWSISLMGGTNATFGDASKNVPSKSLFGPTVNVALNKWFTPSVGTRVVGEWNQSHIVSHMLCTDIDAINNWGGNIDVLINPLNIWSTNIERKFNPVLFAGLGYMHTFNNGISPIGDYVVPRVGLQLNYDFTEAWGMNVEGNAMLMNDKFDNIIGGARYDGRLNILAGITYKFKNSDSNRGFNYVMSYDQTEIDKLNNKINEQRVVIDSLLAHPVKVVDRVVVTENMVTKEIIPITISFKLNSFKIDKQQLANIDNIAIFLKDNPELKLNVIGYADSKTGNPSYNKKLSLKRAENVSKILFEKYNISQDRLNIGAEGDAVQNYEVNEWNRAVIFMK